MELKTEVKLEDTIKLMTSDDYKKRFKAEYIQLEIRCEKLADMIERYKKGILGFEPTCPIEILEKQLEHMREYLWILEERSFMEGINLFAINPMKKEMSYVL